MSEQCNLLAEGPPPIRVSHLAESTATFYRAALEVLGQAGIPYLVGGAYAVAHYAGIERNTKDLDVFVRPRHVEPALAALGAAGFPAELVFPHWLGKVYGGESYIDLIFNSGNGVALVDDAWFEHAVRGNIFDLPVLICPAEETIWSKAFVIERERYDGADVVHLVRAQGRTLDWERLLVRFGRHWRVLLGHLVFVGFVYPSERDCVPDWVMRELLARVHRELGEPLPAARVCQGTLLSREQYLVDVRDWGYEDGRLREGVQMTPTDIARWTEAIEDARHTRAEHEGNDSHRCGR